MKSFKQFLLETPEHVSDSQYPYRDAKLKADDIDMSHPPKGQKKSSVGQYDVYHHDADGHHTFWMYHPEKKQIHLVLRGMGAGENEFTVGEVRSHKDRTTKAHEFYHHLITNHNMTIISDSKQSHSGSSIWKKLMNKSDVEVKTRTGYGVDREVHEDDFDDSSRFIARKKIR